MIGGKGELKMKVIKKGKFLEVKFNEKMIYIIQGGRTKAKIINTKTIEEVEAIINKYDTYADLVINL